MVTLVTLKQLQWSHNFLRIRKNTQKKNSVHVKKVVPVYLETNLLGRATY
jgi:hypothetical protein